MLLHIFRENRKQRVGVRTHCPTLRENYEDKEDKGRGWIWIQKFILSMVVRITTSAVTYTKIRNSIFIRLVFSLFGYLCLRSWLFRPALFAHSLPQAEQRKGPFLDVLLA